MDRRFFRHNVRVGTTEAPEEILTSLSGTCGLWQICICVVCCVTYFLNAMDEFAFTITSPHLNYTCKDSNDSCKDIHGNDCENFIFEGKPNNMTTFTELFRFVCDNADKIYFVEQMYRVGSLMSPLLVGICVTKFGIRATAMAMLPLQCLTGVLIINLEKEELLMIFVFTHAIFTSVTELIPVVAVCDASGNKWRTLGIICLMFSRCFCFLIFPSICGTFGSIVGLMGLISILPLSVLIPLLYYQDSPNYMGVTREFPESEEILRKIAAINKSPLPPEARIRPVQLIAVGIGLKGRNQVTQTTFLKMWKPAKIKKAYSALLWLHFCNGFYLSISLFQIFKDPSNLHWSGLCNLVGVIFASIGCHFVPHKVLLGIVNFAKSASVGGLLIYTHHFKDTQSAQYVILLLLGGALATICSTILQNLAPRMLPTEKRMLLFGLCLDALYAGNLIASLINQYTQNIFLSAVVVLIIGPILEALACLYLWDVHNRELPDFLVDCLKFEKFYKPTRHYLIFDVPSQHEIEVKRVNLDADGTEERVVEKRHNSRRLSFSEIIEFSSHETDEGRRPRSNF